MTDPRFTDDTRFSDPVICRDENVGGMWSWVAGVALLLLIGFVILAGWKNNHNSNTASSGSSPPSTASRTVTPPSTTGSGSSSLQPFSPAPSTPALSKSGMQ